MANGRGAVNRPQRARCRIAANRQHYIG